jgi:hypothetical protein
MKLENLTIGQFIKCKTISEFETDVLDKSIKMLAIVSNKTFDEIEAMPVNELTDALKQFNEIEKLTENTKVRMKFKVKGRKFECIWQTQKLGANQYIDATSFCKDEKDIVNNIHNILASICVERTWYGKKMKYNPENHKEIADLFYNHMKITSAYPIMLFFCKYFEELHSNILIYLEEAAEKSMKMAMNHPKVVEVLKRSGDGLQS